MSAAPASFASLLLAVAPACGVAFGQDVRPDAWRDAARRHGEVLRDRDRVRGEVTHETDFGPFTAEITRPGPVVIDEPGDGEPPAWVGDAPPADRAVVSGPLVTDEEGGPPAARRAAEAEAARALADAAGLPPGAVDPADAAAAVRRSAVVTSTRTTGANEFAVHRGHLLVDVSPAALHDLRAAHRRRLGERRAAWLAGGAGGCVLLFGGLWGAGRRKLRTSG